jgi:hypothetical protein
MHAYRTQFLALSKFPTLTHDTPFKLSSQRSVFLLAATSSRPSALPTYAQNTRNVYYTNHHAQKET